MIRMILSTLTGDLPALTTTQPQLGSIRGAVTSRKTAPVHPSPRGPLGAVEALHFAQGRTQTGPNRMAANTTSPQRSLWDRQSQSPFPIQDGPMAVSRPNLMPIAENGREDTYKFAQLMMFNTVFIINDSGSMNEEDGTQVTAPDGTTSHLSRWETLVDGMRYIVDLVCQYDSDGVDVHFLYNDAMDKYGIDDGQHVLDPLMREIRLDDLGGGMVVGQVLWMVLQTYLDNYEDFYKKMEARAALRPQAPRKLNLIVITDSKADDTEEVEQIIVDVANKLEVLGAPPHQLGIQFLQVGQDKDAAKWLKSLGDDLHQHDVKHVSATTCPPPYPLQPLICGTSVDILHRWWTHAHLTRHKN